MESLFCSLVGLDGRKEYLIMHVPPLSLRTLIKSYYLSGAGSSTSGRRMRLSVICVRPTRRPVQCLLTGLIGSPIVRRGLSPTRIERRE